MKSIFYLFFSTSLFISFISCEPIPIDADIPDSSSKICVNALFGPDTIWIARITKGKHILGEDRVSSTSSYLPFENAQVTITEQGNTSTTMEHFKPASTYYSSEGGWYSISEKPKGKRTYTIHVRVPGLEEISATSTIPSIVPITRIEPITHTPDENGMISLYVHFQDPAEISNYYQLVLITQTTQGTNNQGRIIYKLYEEIETKDPQYQNNKSASEFDLYGDDLNDPRAIFFSDADQNGKLIRIPVLIPVPSSNTTSQIIALRNLSKDYYQYYTSALLQYDTYGDLFSQPVQVYTNVENGFGIFAGYNQSEYRVYPK